MHVQWHLALASSVFNKMAAHSGGQVTFRNLDARLWTISASYEPVCCFRLTPIDASLWRSLTAASLNQGYVLPLVRVTNRQPHRQQAGVPLCRVPCQLTLSYAHCRAPCRSLSRPCDTSIPCKLRTFSAAAIVRILTPILDVRPGCFFRRIGSRIVVVLWLIGCHA